MIPTLEYLNEKFDYYNNLCFDGKLPRVTIQLTTSKRFLGNFSYKQNRLTRRYSDVKIKINRRLDCEQDVIDDTLIHEMIHYYVFFNRIQDTSPHGVAFVGMMNSINRKYNRHISILHRSEAENPVIKADTKPKTRLVVVAVFSDGKCGVKLVPMAEDRLRLFHTHIKRISELASVAYYLSEDSYFAKFHSSIAMRFNIVNEQEVKAHLSDARKITIN